MKKKLCSFLVTVVACGMVSAQAADPSKTAVPTQPAAGMTPAPEIKTDVKTTESATGKPKVADKTKKKETKGTGPETLPTSVDTKPDGMTGVSEMTGDKQDPQR